MRRTGVRVQFCMARLIHDVKFLTTLPDRATETYGGILLMLLRDLFALLHRRDRMNPAAWKHALHLERNAILAMAACAQQGRPVFDYLVDTFDTTFTRHPAPSLLPKPD